MSGKFPTRTKIAVLLSIVAIFLFLILAPPLPQDQSYHSFADQRTVLGTPNFWDVVSNFLFVVVGLVGLFRFRDFASRIVSVGIFFTAFGSAYYHLHPNDARLFWDRLPMTVVFMSVFALSIRRRDLVAPLVIVGAASIIWWRITDNLWPYGLVQFGTMVALLIVAIKRDRHLWPIFIFYGFSKIAEHFDKQIFAVSPLSGHTLKHLLAGIATWCIFRWMQGENTGKGPRTRVDLATGIHSALRITPKAVHAKLIVQ